MTYFTTLMGASGRLPLSGPLPAAGLRCHALRVVYRVDGDALIIAGVFSKKTRATPRPVIEVCWRKLRDYDARAGERR